LVVKEGWRDRRTRARLIVTMKEQLADRDAFVESSLAEVKRKADHGTFVLPAPAVAFFTANRARMTEIIADLEA
jgi:hypothetical protein